MRLLVSGNGLVDLRSPISVTEKQKVAIFDFFKRNFSNFEVIEIVEPQKSFESVGNEKKKWSLDDYAILLEHLDEDTIARKIGRSAMSVRMKLGEFVPEFNKWLKQKNLANQKNKENVKRFLEDKER